MAKGKVWNRYEEKKLIDNYYRKTIFELMEILPDRTQESINNKIKRLKADGRIKGSKEIETLQRAYDQRDEKK